MADKTSIAFGLKIDGVEQSIKSVKDLKGAIKSLQDEAESSDIGSEQYKNAIEQIELLNDKLKEVSQTEKQAAKSAEEMADAQKEAAKETGDLRKQFEKLEDELFMLAGQGKQNTKEFRDLSNEAANLNKQIEHVNQSLEGGAATKSAEGYQMLSGSFTSLKEGILELDFGKVKDGLMQAKQGFVMFGQGAKTALQGVKGALLATGIGALVVLLGTIVAYWDDIKGAIDGVTSEQKKLNAAAADNLAVEQDKLKSLEASDNLLKLQGKSERQILELKVAQLDAVYEAQEAQLMTTIQTQIAQVEAEKRNKAILSGMLEFALKPVEHLLSALDMAGKVLGKNFGLAESIKKMSDESVSSEDAEKEAARKKELDATIQQLKDLQSKRAGYQIAIKKIDDDAAKEAEEKRNAAAEKKKVDDEKALQEQLRIYNEMADRENAMIDAQEAREKKLKDSRLALNKQMLDEKHAQQIAQDEIDGAAMVAKAKAEEELEKKKQDEIVKIVQDGLTAAQNLSDIFFLFKKNKAEKGSKEEMELAKKQFNLNKALQLGMATIDGFKSITSFLSTNPLTVLGVPNPGAIAGLIALSTTTAATIAKIAASKFEGGGGGGATGGGGGAAPMPSIPAPPTISTSNNNTNQSTLFDESGQNLSKQKQPQINVTATVGVDEIASKSNRVSVLENQSTF